MRYRIPSHGKWPLIVLVLLWALTLALGAGAETLTGRVVKVYDGDTLTILTTAKEQVRVRLAEIDAPELKGQPYGQQAKQALADRVFGRVVEISVVDRDRYGRVVGHVLVEEQNINAAMVKEGHAWVYTRYARDPRLLVWQATAQAERHGLWALQPDQRIPPWEWRQQQRRR